MTKISGTKIFTLILVDELKTFLYFPVWWYSKGFLRALRGTINAVFDFEKTLGFMIWTKNLFNPMYGQRDIAGKIISFFLRLVQIIARGIVLLIIIIIAIGFIILWLLLPIIIIYQIIFLIIK